MEEHLKPGSRRRPGASSRYRSVRRLRVFRKVRRAWSTRDVGPSGVREGRQYAAVLLAGEGGRSKFRLRGVHAPQIEPRIILASLTYLRVAQHRPRVYISYVTNGCQSETTRGRSPVQSRDQHTSSASIHDPCTELLSFKLHKRYRHFSVFLSTLFDYHACGVYFRGRMHARASARDRA